jgi:hypothetical protein
MTSLNAAIHDLLRLRLPVAALDVTFLELDVPAKRRDHFETVIIPAVVAQGIAERAIHRATAKMAPEEVDYLDYESKKRKGEVLSRMKPLAEQEIRELVAETHVEADDRDFAEITKAVHEQLDRLRKPKPGSSHTARWTEILRSQTPIGRREVIGAPPNWQAIPVLYRSSEARLQSTRNRLGFGLEARSHALGRVGGSETLAVWRCRLLRGTRGFGR